MPILVALLLGIAALAFVLYPLYRRPVMRRGAERGTRGGADAGGKVADVNIDDREQTARTALQEIELDYQLGNLAETDYRTLRERYMRRALAAVKTRQKSEQELDEAIEEQLRFLREKEDNETESE